MEDKKPNKKTRGIIIAAMVLLLIAIMCFCGVTFARYITKSSVPTQQATVAKWGFVVSANAENLFGKGYNKGEIVAKPDEAGAVVDVKAATSTVAPGTKGEMTFGVTGSAEVLAQLKVAVKADTLKDISLTKGSGETAEVYNPIKWTLSSKSAADSDFTAVTDAENKTLAEIVEELKKITAKIEIGQSFDTTYKLSWKWELGTSEDPTDATNRKDTALAYAAEFVNGTGSKPTDGKYGDYTVSVAGTGDAQVITVVDDLGDSDASNDVTYTATIGINFDMSIIVMQIQTPTTGA